MWGLKQRLTNLKSHLPSGYDPSKGVRSLFPSGYKGSISPLRHYVFFTYARLATDYNFGPTDQYYGSGGNLYFLADGMGRWFFSWQWWPITLSTTYLRQAGFIFLFSEDGSARGFVDPNNPAPNTKSCNSGTDPWIAANWPQAFGKHVHITLQEGSTLDESLIWTTSGFAASKFAALKGSNTACASTLSGSTLFPYPITPIRLLSEVGVLLGGSQGIAGQLLAHCLSKLPKTFVKNGLTFEATVPPGMKATDSGSVTVTFSSTDKKNQGTYTWTFPALTSKVTGNLALDVAGGSCTIDYTYSSAAPSSKLSLGELDYTVSFTGTDKSTSSVKQNVVDGLVTSQTSSVSNSSGKSTTTLTINADGTIDISNPAAAPTIGVKASPAQKVALPDKLTGPTTSFITELLDLNAPTGTQTTFTQDSPVGPLTTVVSVQMGSGGSVQSYTVTVSSQPGAEVSVVGAMTIDVSGVAGETANIQFSDEGVDYSLSYSMSFDGSGTQTVNGTFQYSDGDGNTTSISETAVNGTTTSQSSTASDGWGNTSTSGVTFNADGSFSLQITTTDAEGNGTTETITGDSAGNVTGDTTGTIGGEGSGGSTSGGGTVGGDDDDDDDDDDSGDDDDG